MVSVSNVLAKKFGSGVVGMLNPSDAHAVRFGRIGTFFDGGHIALEEYMAVATTMLTMNRSLNPDLWKPNHGRHHAVPL